VSGPPVRPARSLSPWSDARSAANPSPNRPSRSLGNGLAHAVAAAVAADPAQSCGCSTTTSRDLVAPRQGVVSRNPSGQA
jgi:hypothetical protein